MPADERLEKVAVFGAGHVGSTTAFHLAMNASVDVALNDVEEGRAEGLALDISQALAFAGSTSIVKGGSSAVLAADSSVIVVTAGFPRMPGMSRTDLTVKNSSVVTGICSEIASLAPDAVLIIVTNPVDEMTYDAWKSSGFPERRVMGMAGVLDTSRFLYFLKEIAELDPREVTAMVLGSHGDEMVPLPDWSTATGVPLSEKLDAGVLERCVERARDGGAEIVGLLKTGSAYYAPAESIATMVLAILGDTGRMLPVSAYAHGEYGIEDVFIGMPSRLGRVGVTEVVELPLSTREIEALRKAAEAVRSRVTRGPGTNS